MRQVFKADDQACIGDGNVLFGDFLDPTADIQIYKEITDMDNVSLYIFAIETLLANIHNLILTVVESAEWVFG